MTPEEIEEAGLDKVDLSVTDSFKLLTKTELEQERAKEAKEAKSQDASEASTTESSLIKIK